MGEIEFYKKKGNGILLKIKAVPNSSKNRFCGIMDGALKVKIKAPAVENKANEELIKFLSKELGIPKSQISIDSGNTSKLKIVYIETCSIEQIKTFCDTIIT